MGNFRFAKYNVDAAESAIDDPNKARDLTPDQLDYLQQVATGVNASAENPYTKALFFGDPLTQTGSVKDFSQNNADAVYCGGTTDAEVYSTTSSYLTTLGGTAPNNKGLSIAASKILWRLQNNESLFLQLRVLKDTLPVGAEQLIGNCSGGTVPGFILAITPGGALQPYVKIGSLTVALVGGSSTTLVTAGVPFTVTIWIDGVTKLMNGWVNGILQANWTNKPIVPDGTSYQSNNAGGNVWCLGNGGDTVSPSVRTMFAYKYAAVRIAVIEANKTLQNVPLLDWKFNRNPNSILSLTDVTVV